MFAVCVWFEVEPVNAAEFEQLVMQQALNSLQREPDCHQFDVCRDPERPQRFYLYELYTDRAAFDDHLTSAHFRDFDATVTPMLRSKTVELLTRLGPH